MKYSESKLTQNKLKKNNKHNNKRLSALSLSILFTLSSFPQMHSVALAQAVVAPNAPVQNQPGMGAPAGSNQVPVVNIVTPNAAGVSHNIYNQFNVNQQGLILNNSTWNTQTQLGGWIQGNPNHPYGNARLIINEVNGSNPSMLNGYIEIAGQKADIIIANPAGISIDGAGFINASGVTLTTGNINYNNWGGVESYRVGTGKITINGKGLDTSNTDYTNIIARAVEVNSGIWANDLRVTAGTGLVSPDAQPISMTALDTNGQPLFAIDVSQIGGMYAGKIRLIGTEAGVGVRNAGNIGASAGQVQITADGRLINSGSISSSDNTARSNAGIQIATTGDLQNLGNLYSQGNANLQTSQTLQNQGTLAAGGNLNIQAQTVANQNNAQSTGLIAAGMNSDGSLNNNGNLSINTVQLTNDGKLLAAKDLTINAQQTLQNQGTIAAQSNLSIQAQTLNNQNTLYAGQNATLNALTLNNNSSTSKLSATGNLTLQAGSINNQNGTITAQNIALQGQTTGSATSLNNQGGIIASLQNINAKAASLDNTTGKLNAGGDITLALIGNYTHEQASEIIANNNLTLTLTGNLTNQGKLLAGQNITLTADNINNTATGEITATTNTITAAQNLTNRGLIDGITVLLTASQIDNIGTGRIYGNQLALSAQTLNNRDETLTPPGGSTSNAAVIAAREQLDIGVQTLSNINNALIYSAGDINIGGALDTNNEATGTATLIVNDGAIIEAAGTAPGSQGDITITALDVKNLNSSFATRDIVTATQDYFTHEIPLANLIWNNNDIIYVREGIYGNDSYQAAGKGVDIATTNALLGNSSHYFLLVPSTVYTKAQTDHVLNRGGLHQAALVAGLPNLDAYAPADPIWNLFGLTSPTAAPAPPVVDCGTVSCTPAQQNTYDTYQSNLTQWKTDNTGAYWNLSLAIADYNTDLHTRMISAETLHQYTETQHSTEVVSSNPGQILAAGNITINGKLTNQNSRVMAGGTITADASSVNIATHGTDYTVREGTQIATIRQASGRTWYLPVTYAPVTTGSTQTDLGVFKYQQNAYTSSGNTGAGIIQIPGLSGVISTIPPNISLPDNSLYRILPGTNRNYLIETDPRFANYGSWLSSDFMLQQLGLDPAGNHKRLGDGFYEQQLIREQIGALTGYRFLAGYSSDEESYSALMNAGVAFAKKMGITLGEELTPEQLSQLDSNIVWLVSKQVTLADGSVEKLLVPQVYLKETDGTASSINTAGALMSGNNVVIGGNNDPGTFYNTATLAARENLIVSAQNIHNELGQMHGNNTYLQAEQDITNRGGIISADNSITIQAGRDFKLSSTTFESQTANHTVKDISNIGAVYLSGKNAQNSVGDGQIYIQAGRDISSQGGMILNATDTDNSLTRTTTANTTLVAGNNIELSSIETSRSETFNYDAMNWYSKTNTGQSGTQIQSNTDINLIAGNQLNITASELESGKGDLNLSAKEVHIGTADVSTTSMGSAYTQHKGRMSKKSNLLMNYDDTQSVVGSSLGGTNINIITSGDQTYTASNIIADNNINLISQGGNITVASDESKYTGMNYSQNQRSGLLTGHNQVGLNFGKEQTTQTEITNQTAAIGSTIGALGGNINISAQKGNYTQIGSDALALQGDLNLVAQNIHIEDARESSTRLQTQEYKKSGLTIGLSSPLIAAAQQAKQMSDASKRTSNSRMDALAAGAVALNIFNAVDTANMASNPAEAASVSISLTLGTQKSQSMGMQASNSGKTSTLAAGKNINLIATGDGSKESGNILIQGSNVKAGKDILLLANNQIDIKASNNTNANLSENKSSSGAISVGYKFGTQGNGLYASISGSKGKGSGQGIEQSWNPSKVQAGQTLTVISGGDLNLIGSQLIGNTVKADIGGNLTIQSLQDLELSQSKQKNTSFGLSISQGGGGANFSQSKSSASGLYISANEYAGIMAGDGGFQINVDGHTALIGGVIASTDKAVQDNKNQLTTGSISVQDLSNASHYESKGSSIGIGGGFDFKNNKASASPPMSLSGKESGTDQSTTLAGISGGKITITNEEEQQRRTGQTAEQAIENINRDITTGMSTGGIQKNWDSTDKMVDEMQANLEIAQGFTQAATDFVGNRVKEITRLKDELDKQEALLKEGKGDQYLVNSLKTQIAEKEKIWGMGGNGRLAITAITAAIGGNVSGSGADMVQAAAINYIQGKGAEAIKNYINKYHDGDDTLRAAFQGILACAGSSAKGSDCGSAALGAAGSVVINKIMGGTKIKDPVTGEIREMSLEERQQRENLVNTILTGTVEALGGDAAAANIAAKIEMENNVLSPKAQDERVQAYKLWDGGTKSPELAKKIRELDQIDQRSDQLRDMYLDGSISKEQMQQLANYLDVYFVELQDEYGTEQALQMVSKFLEGGNINDLTSGESYAKLGEAHKQRQKQEKADYLSKYSGLPGLWEWFVYASPKGTNEIRYEEAGSTLAGYEENKKWAEVGEPALMFLPGGIGNIVRATEMAGGSYQIGGGAAKIYEGDTLGGVSDVALGGLRVFASVYTQKMINSKNSTIPGVNSNDVIKTGNPNEIRYSQNTVSYNKTDRLSGSSYTYDDLVSSMKIEGWKGDPVDVIKMPDGKLTSIDNTRITAAREAEINIEMRVRNYDDKLTISEKMRFSDPKKGFFPNTWGEAIEWRINKQSGGFGQNNPYGSYESPLIKGTPGY